MNIRVFAVCSVLYIILLFIIAYVTDKKAEKGRHFAANPYVYALSLAVYCTAWTFYGSVGKAVKSGLGYLPIYLGPTIIAPLWFIILRKIILISKEQRITSIADFISSRYGKSAALGVLVTVIAFFGLIPYISLQLKAISDSFMVLGGMQHALDLQTNIEGFSTYYSTAFYIAILLTLFTILFGARNLEPNERHEGMVAAIAFESLVKLVAFLAVGIFVTYVINNGFSDIFQKAYNDPRTASRLYFSDTNASTEWFWLGILSMGAIILLPRQFHIAVVENSNLNHIKKALWLFPLYLLIINIFVLPIAITGTLQLPADVRPDTYVLELPLHHGANLLALLVFIGGFSASTSMVIVETNALSIMLSNHIFLPPLIRWLAQRDNEQADFSMWIIWVRRITIIFIMLLAFLYVRTIATNRELVSIGLISFAAVLQFAPSVFIGLFWKNATKVGAIVGLTIGFLIWAITLPIPTLADYGVVSKNIVTEGYFGFWWLKPYALFGLEGFDQISHAAFWSLFFNTIIYVMVSLFSKQTTIEATQADYFVNINKYINVGSGIEVLHREAIMAELQFLMIRFLGEDRTKILLKNYETEHNINLSKIVKANDEIINFVETHMAGALGASSAKILMDSVTKENPISFDEMLRVLEQTQEVVISNKKLEETTHQLKTANEQLKQLERLKAEFISNVTHELRTPMTSIRALTKILLDNKDLPREQQDEFLSIVSGESERMSRLINQVLDIEKMQSNAYNWRFEKIELAGFINQITKSFIPSFEEKDIVFNFKIKNKPVYISGDSDRMTQVIVNLLSNALKFAPTEGGKIEVELAQNNGTAIIKVRDNGNGIPIDKQKLIFERFTQIQDPSMGKPTGSGLGLFITKQILEHHNGDIKVENNTGRGASFIIEIPVESSIIN
jgi:Na+/proline symporter/signal transduction histidine kinase